MSCNRRGGGGGGGGGRATYEPRGLQAPARSAAAPEELCTRWVEHIEPRLLRRHLCPEDGETPAASDADTAVPLYRVLPLLPCTYADESTGIHSASSLLRRCGLSAWIWEARDEELLRRTPGGVHPDAAHYARQRNWGARKPLLALLQDRQRVDVCPLWKYRSYQESRRAALHTLQYMFFHVKNGIYVRIHQGRVACFAPFHCVEKGRRNTWTGVAGPHSLRVGERFQLADLARLGATSAGMLRAMREAVDEYYDSKRREWGAGFFSDEGYLTDVREWWANAYIVDNVPGSSSRPWSDAKDAELLEMLRETCAAAFVPDCEFFLNKRDFPHMYYDRKRQVLAEPYPFLFGGCDARGEALGVFPQLAPPPGMDYDARARFAPVFSFAVGPHFADISMPTVDDWRAATGADADLRAFLLDEAHAAARDFERKTLGTAVWRGSSTGPGVTPADNQRLALVALARRHPDRLDCELTGLNLRDRVAADGALTHLSLQTALELCGCKTVEELRTHMKRRRRFLSFAEQCRHKYVIYVQGHSAAFRYGKLMFSNSVILRVESTVMAPDLWFSAACSGAAPHREEAGEAGEAGDGSAWGVGGGGSMTDVERADHLVIRADLSDLLDALDWCETHPRECARIARNAFTLADQLFTKDSILQYWHAALVRTHLNEHHFISEYVPCAPDGATMA